MIQFNLLPSIKREYVKARRNRRLTVLAAGLVGIISLAVLAILFVSVQIVQKNYSKDLARDIKSQSKTLQGISDLNKILTIQNQLGSLTALHDQKPVTTLLFGYLKQFTPAKASIASVIINFDKQTVEITGSADSINTVNKFVDTLKFTDYKTEEPKQGKAFSLVVLADFGRDDKGASYKLSMAYDNAIFSSNSKPTLIIPANKITTRSETEKPDELFQPLSNQKEDKR